MGEKTIEELEREKLDLEKWKIEQEWKRQDQLEAMVVERLQFERDKLELEKYKIEAEKKKLKLVEDIVLKALNKLGTKSKVSLPPNIFLCPTCLEKGKQAVIVIDVANMPDIVKCPECGREFLKQTCSNGKGQRSSIETGK